MIYVFLAEGFEECEALAPVDILRRGGLEVKTVGVGSKTVVGSHGIPVVADITESEVLTENLQAVVLPGGLPGTLNLEKSDTVQKMLDYARANSAFICAICAAPSILGHKGFLEGKKAICFTGFEKDLYGAEIVDMPTVKDGKIITAAGAGAAFDFGFAILAAVTGDEMAAENLRKNMKCK